MPNVRDSSGMIGTICAPDLLVAQQRGEDAHEGHRGRDLPLAGAVELGLELRQRGHGQLGGRPAPHRERAAERGATLAHVLHHGRVVGRLVELGRLHLLIGERELEPVAEMQERGLGHLLRLVGDHLALAGDAHPIALHGLGQDHRRLAGVLDRRVVGSEHLLLIVAAAIEQPDLLIGHVLDPLEQARVAAEEVLADIGAVAGLERLVVAVDAGLHDLQQGVVLVLGEERVPARAPDDLDHVPARAAEVGLELLDDLAVAAHRSVEALKVAVHHPDQVVEVLAPGEPDRAHRLGFVHLAVAAEGPDLAAGRLREPAGLQVLHEPCLVDRRDRPDPQRDRRELPEVGHQPGMRIGGEAGAVDLLAEPEQLALGQPSLEIRARVVAGGGMALEVDQVAAVALARGVPEVVEADLVQGGQGLIARDVAAELRGDLVGAHDDRDRVPADDRPQPPVELGVTGVGRLAIGRDRVDVRRVEARDRAGTGLLRALDDPGQQIPRPHGTIVRHDSVERLEPLARLDRVDIGAGAVRCGGLNSIRHGPLCTLSNVRTYRDRYWNSHYTHGLSPQSRLARGHRQLSVFAGRRRQERQSGGRADSSAAMIWGSSGGTFVGQRATRRPSPPMRYFVKFHAGRPRARLPGQIGPQRVRVGTDRHLLGQREADAVVLLTEAADLAGVVVLLAGEVAGWGPEHLQAATAETLVELLQTLILRRVAAFAGGVDDQGGASAQGFEVELGAVEQSHAMGVQIGRVGELAGPPEVHAQS